MSDMLEMDLGDGSPLPWCASRRDALVRLQRDARGEHVLSTVIYDSYLVSYQLAHT